MIAIIILSILFFYVPFIFLCRLVDRTHLKRNRYAEQEPFVWFVPFINVLYFLWNAVTLIQINRKFTNWFYNEDIKR